MLRLVVTGFGFSSIVIFVALCDLIASVNIHREFGVDDRYASSRLRVGNQGAGGEGIGAGEATLRAGVETSLREVQAGLRIAS